MDPTVIAKQQATAAKVLQSLDADKIHAFGLLIKQTIDKGNKILVCGNGGSCGQAMHFEAELVGRYLSDRKALPCKCLGTNPSTATCVVNDFGADNLFSREVEAYGQQGDVLIGLTTSGNSPNIDKAIIAAKQKGMHTIALLGKSGGKTKDIVDDCYIVDSQSTARIQEAHIFIIHCICDYLENE